MDSLVLDIESTLQLVENILCKYINIPEHAVFLKGYRNPLTDRSKLHKYEKMQLVKNEPWHPYISAYLCRDILYFHLAEHNEYKSMLYHNPVIDRDKDMYPIPEDTTVEEIIMSYLPEDRPLSPEDSIALLNLVSLDNPENGLADITKNLINRFPNYVFEIDISSQYVVITPLDNILAIRYKEVLFEKKLITANEKDKTDRIYDGK